MELEKGLIHLDKGGPIEGARASELSADRVVSSTSREVAPLKGNTLQRKARAALVSSTSIEVAPLKQ